MLSLPSKNMDTTVTVGFAQPLSDTGFNLTVSIMIPLSQVLTQNIPGKKRGVNTVKPKSLFVYLLKKCGQCHSLCSGHR